eukprot:m.468789 g.468789  ORF g.468789 m.468789 type:complete len:63 (+) comp57085_c2_seq1:234-422(+)
MPHTKKHLPYPLGSLVLLHSRSRLAGPRFPNFDRFTDMPCGLTLAAAVSPSLRTFVLLGAVM